MDNKRKRQQFRLVYDFSSGPEEAGEPKKNKGQNDDKNSHGEGTASNRSEVSGELYKRKVVLVDDDALIRSSFQIIMTRFGFEILATMADGRELVDSIDKMNPKPDVIVMDERMPRMSGIEAAKIIRAKYPKISMVFVSADESAKEEAKRAGAKVFLKKPVRIGDLVYALNRS
jgi:CheY-like chemotaxis protein